MAGDLGGLDGGPDLGTDPEAQFFDCRRCHLGDDRQGPIQYHPDPFEGRLEVGDAGLPDVAGAAVGSRAVEGHGGRGDHEVDRAFGGLGQEHTGPERRHGDGARGRGLEQVESGQRGDIPGLGAAPDLAGTAGLGDGAILEDDQPIRQGGRLDRVVGDEKRRGSLGGGAIILYDLFF